MFQTLLGKLAHTNDDFTGLVLRLTLAIAMFPHGAQKALGWWDGYGYSATMEYFTSSGMPALIAVLVIAAEFLGPIGLAVGFLSRFTAASLSVVMIGAITMGHWQHGFFMNWFGGQEGEGFEYHLLVIGLSMALLIKGSGPLSIDRLLSR